MSIIFNDDPNSFDLMDESARPLLPVYIIILSFTIIMTIMIWKKYKMKKSKPAKYLSLAFSMYAILIAFTLIGYLEMYFTGYKKILYRLSLTLGYFGIMIANCFIILFGMYIFDDKQDYHKSRILVGISVAIGILVGSPWNYYGYNDEMIPDGLRSFRLIASGIMMLFSVFVYFRIYLRAVRIAKRVDDGWAKKGFQFIAFSQLCEIGFFFFSLLDIIVFTFTEINGYTIFIYFSWIMVMFFLAFAYVGFIMPEWFKNLYTSKKKE